jgi:hypothetical protein
MLTICKHCRLYRNLHNTLLLPNNSKDAVALEQRLTAAHLAHQLARRATQEELQKRGLYTDSTRAAHELEFKLNQRLLAQRLKKRPAVCSNCSATALHYLTVSVAVVPVQGMVHALVA